MKRRVLGMLLLLALWMTAGMAEQAQLVAKVTTKRGTLKLRAKPEDKGLVLDEIPNGTCILVSSEGGEWTCVQYKNRTGYCKSSFLTFLREADTGLLEYRVLRKGDKGEDVLAVKERLQELGYIRSGSELTNIYNDTAAERVSLFQRQVGMTEDGVASQELQAYLFSDSAPVCTQTLPKIRSRVSTRTGSSSGTKREICGCCFGEGCECCGYTGWIEIML